MMIKRENRDTSNGDTGGSLLKSLSNDVLFSFFNGEKIQKILQVEYQKALDGDMRAIKDILDRSLGKPKDQIREQSRSQELTAGIFVMEDFK